MRRFEGWYHALFVAAISFPLSSLVARYGVEHFQMHPVVYSCLVLLTASFGLLLFAQPGPLGRETLRLPSTWAYGIAQLLSTVFATAALVYVSATEASVLLRVSSVMVFLLSVLGFRQPAGKVEYAGLAVVVAGIILAFMQTSVPAHERLIFTFVLIGFGLTQAGRLLLAEFHKTNRLAGSFRHNLRVTAVVVGVSSLVMAAFFVSLAFMFQAFDMPPFLGLPGLDDLFNPSTFLLSSFLGLILVSVSKYSEFFSAKEIGAKNLLAVVCLQPIFTLLFEWLASRWGLMDFHWHSFHDSMGLWLVVLGSLVMALGAIRRPQKSGKDKITATQFASPAEVKALQANMRTALTLSKGNTQQAARLLKLDKNTWQALNKLTPKEVLLPSEVLQAARENFTNSVALSDALTGLGNRLHFNTLLEKALASQAQVTVLYIDLNKFKPVNDTYGHEAGDVILQKVAGRLLKALPKTATAARLGGDEFAVLLPHTSKAKAQVLVSNLKKVLAAPYNTSYGIIRISASVGLACSPQDGKSPEALLATADKRMYGNKR